MTVRENPPSRTQMTGYNGRLLCASLQIWPGTFVKRVHRMREQAARTSSVRFVGQ